MHRRGSDQVDTGSTGIQDLGSTGICKGSRGIRIWGWDQQGIYGWDQTMGVGSKGGDPPSVSPLKLGVQYSYIYHTCICSSQLLYELNYDIVIALLQGFGTVLVLLAADVDVNLN